MGKWLGSECSHPKVIKKGYEMFISNKENKWTSINADVRNIVYKLAIKFGK
jgi:hypothetical protein